MANCCLIMLVLGMISMSVACLLFLLAALDICPSCNLPYGNMTKATGTDWAQCIFHIFAIIWSIPSLTLFGVGLCCKRCREENVGFHVGNIVCSSLTVICATVAVICIGLRDISHGQNQIMFALVLTGLLLAIGCVVYAICACCCRNKK